MQVSIFMSSSLRKIITLYKNHVLYTAYLVEKKLNVSRSKNCPFCGSRDDEKCARVTNYRIHRILKNTSADFNLKIKWSMENTCKAARKWDFWTICSRNQSIFPKRIRCCSFHTGSVIGKTNKLAGRRGVHTEVRRRTHILAGTTDWNSRGMQVRADNKINCQIPARWLRLIAGEHWDQLTLIARSFFFAGCPQNNLP